MDKSKLLKIIFFVKNNKIMKKLLIWGTLLVSIIITAQNKSVLTENGKLKLFKKNARASYYHDKFNGKKTASGTRFDNSKFTVAHKKFLFGTKLKITNETNNKFVIVEVTDRGPFIKGREIDLSKRAFMNISSDKICGLLNVKIEIIEN